MSSSHSDYAVTPETSVAPAAELSLGTPSGRLAEGEFFPRQPQSLEETGLRKSDIQDLLLKGLLSRNTATGRELADQVRLPFGIVQGVLNELKAKFQVAYKNSAPMSDYEYELTETGEAVARRLSEKSTYYGAAPVELQDYLTSVGLQSIRRQKLSFAMLKRAYREMLLPSHAVSQIGQAIRAGRGLFLYGAPGNGKTTVAERIMQAYEDTVWIPRCLSVTGELIRLFDPSCHEEVPTQRADVYDECPVDARWVQIRRPTVVLGGEMTLSQLEVGRNASTGINEAPVQLKSNCGALVIDDFGRQQFKPDDLLSRWIVPLEKGEDYLTLQSGRQIGVPFDLVLVISSNLTPAQIGDEAFLRRIHYKVHLNDPSEQEFRTLFLQLAHAIKLRCEPVALDYLLARHYRDANRPLRYCHPRDLLLQIRNYCEFHEQPLEVSRPALDAACMNYFA